MPAKSGKPDLLEAAVGISIERIWREIPRASVLPASRRNPVLRRSILHESPGEILRFNDAGMTSSLWA
jgi:hypothetical protein